MSTETNTENFQRTTAATTFDFSTINTEQNNDFVSAGSTVAMGSMDIPKLVAPKYIVINKPEIVGKVDIDGVLEGDYDHLVILEIFKERACTNKVLTKEIIIEKQDGINIENFNNREISILVRHTKERNNGRFYGKIKHYIAYEEYQEGGTTQSSFRMESTNSNVKSFRFKYVDIVKFTDNNADTITIAPKIQNFIA